MTTTDSLPRTLLDLAGVKRLPPAAGEAALVLIDIQREYRDGGLPLPGVDAAAEEARHLVALARKHDVPVIHVVIMPVPGARCSRRMGLISRSCPRSRPQMAKLS